MTKSAQQLTDEIWNAINRAILATDFAELSEAVLDLYEKVHEADKACSKEELDECWYR